MRLRPETSLLLGALAAYRGTRLVVEDTIADPIREKLVLAAPDGKIATLVTCPHCSGFWISGLVAASLPIPVRYKALAWWAIAGAVSLIYEALPEES